MGILTAISHMLGIFVLSLSILIWFIRDDAISRSTKNRVYIVFSLIFITLVIAFYSSSHEIFNFLLKLNGSVGQTAYPDMRGLSLISFVKIILTYYFLLMGDTSYPGNILWISICGIAFGFWIIRGFVLLNKTQKLLMVLLIIFPVLIFFLGFNSFVPKNFPKGQPKYLIFILPFLLYLLARGVIFKNRLLTVLSMTLLLVIHTGNLSAYYSNAYNYNSYKLIDLNGLSEFIVKYRESGAEYYSDTATSQLKYFPWEKGAGNLWTLLTEWEKDKPGFSVKLPDNVLIHIGGIYRKNVSVWNGFLESLQEHYVLKDCFHSHGAQAFLFSRVTYADNKINKDGEIL